MPTKNVFREKAMKKLEDVLDPELYISIVDLGLVYDVMEKKGTVTIKMTLTTMGCPLYTVLENDIKDKIMSIKGVKEVAVDLVFDPPWTIERVTERGKAIIGI